MHGRALNFENDNLSVYSMAKEFTKKLVKIITDNALRVQKRLTRLQSFYK